MLPRQYKLTRTTFPNRQDKKSSFFGEVLRVQVYTTTKINTPPCFAVVASKRSSDSAVMRNKFKRQVFGLISKHLNDFKELPCRKYIIFPKEHLSTISVEAISKDVEKFVTQQKIP